MAGETCGTPQQNCGQERRISTLEQQGENIKDVLQRLDRNVDLVLAHVSRVAVLEIGHDHQKETLSRAFNRIEDLEAVSGNLTAFMNKAVGMGKLAYILWGALGSGLLLLAVKVLFFMGAHGVTAG